MEFSTVSEIGVKILYECFTDMVNNLSISKLAIVFSRIAHVSVQETVAGTIQMVSAPCDLVNAEASE